MHNMTLFFSALFVVLNMQAFNLTAANQMSIKKKKKNIDHNMYYLLKACESQIVSLVCA